MLARFLKKNGSFLLLLLVIALLTVIYLFFGPEKFVQWIGVENTYLLAFFIGAFGGVSFLTGSSYILLIIGLAAGNANIFLLGIAGGCGITIGDLLFYLLGLKGRETLPRPFKKTTNRFSLWLQKRPGWLIPFVVYFYSVFMPLPNDLLTVSLGLCKCSYKKIVIPLLLGNITFTILLAGVAKLIF